MFGTFSRKYPAALAVFPMALGILISYYLKVDLSFLPEWFFLTAIVTAGILIAVLYPKLQKGELFLFSCLFLLILFGLLSFQFRYYKTSENNISARILQTEPNSVVKGIVAEQPELKDNRMRLIIQLISVNDSSVSGTMLASVYKNKFTEEAAAEFTYGDIVELKGKIEPLPGRRNPGEFDYGRYLKMHGVDAVFSSYGFESITLTGNETQNPWYTYVIIPVKKYSVKVIEENLSGQEAEYLKGLLLGERSNISGETRENFINAGVAHIIAVSGLNVAYVALIIWAILIFIPIKQHYKIFITIASLLFYMDLTGNSPSIVRAVIMASVFLIAQIAGRRPNSYNILSFAALLILVIDPRQLFDAGFILSFSALLSIIIIYPFLNDKLINLKWVKELNSEKLSVKVFKAASALFLGTFAAQLGTLPITAVMFKKISVISLLSNLFAIPLSNISLALGFIMVIVSPLSGWLGSVFGAVNQMLLYIQLLLIEFCAGLDIAYVQTYFVDGMMLIFYYIILILVLTANRSNYIIRLAVSLLLIINFAVWKDVAAMTNEAEITFLNTGSSNCTAVKMPGGTTVLINAGTSSDKYNSAQRTVLPYLKAGGSGKIDLLIMNSMDKDEFRNLLYLVQNTEVKKMMLPLYYKNIIESKYFNSNFKNTAVEYISSSKIINKNGNFRLYIYYDSLYKAGTMMTQFLFGDQSFVFTDAVKPEEIIYNSVYLNDLDLNTQVIRVASSGSFTTTPPQFIAYVNPAYIIIGETVTGRRRLNAEIFKTVLYENGFNVLDAGKTGAVILRTNGDFTRRVVWE